MKKHLKEILCYILFVGIAFLLNQNSSFANFNLVEESQSNNFITNPYDNAADFQVQSNKIKNFEAQDFAIKSQDLFKKDETANSTLFVSEFKNSKNSATLFDLSDEISKDGDTNTVKPSGSEENDLNFDDLNSQTVNDNNSLLPSNISIVESAFWSKNGLFRTLGFTGELTSDQRQKEINWRRTFLTIHQTSGLVTLGLMLASCYTGQMWLDGKSDSPDLHKTLVTSTIIGYSFTGLMALITPPPAIRRDEFSTISVHKALAWLHFGGMVLTPILGSLIEDSKDYYKSAHFHQTSAYITTAIYTSAMLVILLFE